MMTLVNWFLLFVIFSFLGWVTEVIYAYVNHGKWINRGFLYGPFCPIYGAGIVAIYAIFVTIGEYMPNISQTNIFVTFVYVTLITSLIELVTGYVLEKIFHTKWWDYSRRKFNFRGYVCLSFSLMWGIFGTLILRMISPFVVNPMKSFSNQTLIVVASVFFVYFVIDIVFTIRGLIDLRKMIIELEEMSEQMRTEWKRVRQELDMRFDIDVRARLLKEFGDRKTTLENGLNDKREMINDEVRGFMEMKDKMAEEIKALRKQFGDEVDERKEAILSELKGYTPQYVLEARKRFDEEVQKRKGTVNNRLNKARVYRSFPKVDMQSMFYKWEELKNEQMSGERDEEKIMTIEKEKMDQG